MLHRIKSNDVPLIAQSFLGSSCLHIVYRMLIPSLQQHLYQGKKKITVIWTMYKSRLTIGVSKVQKDHHHITSNNTKMKVPMSKEEEE